MDKYNEENNKFSESFLNKISQNRKTEQCSDDTTIFFRNVMKEIMLCGTQKGNNIKPLLSSNVIINSPGNAMDTSRALFCENIKERKTFCMAPPETIPLYSQHKIPTMSNVHLQKSDRNELSLSFLRNQHLSKSRTTTYFVTPNNFSESIQRKLHTNVSSVQHNTVYDSFMKHNLTRSCTQEIDEFKPQFMSTPKKDIHEASRYQKQHDNSSYRSVRNHQVKRPVKKKRATRHLNQTKTDKDIRHKSFSGRLFDAINTSCTTLVKTVKNIFRPKNTLQKTKDDSINETNPSMSCSYSFTNYMRKRDEVMKDGYKEDTNKADDLVTTKERFEDVSMEINNSCKTCNDTVTLKRKLRNDDNLKKTIRKLKLGINLYGCDFKVPN